MTEGPDERPNHLLLEEEFHVRKVVFSASGGVAYRVKRLNATSVEVEKIRDYRLSPEAKAFLRNTLHVYPKGSMRQARAVAV